MNHVRNTYPSLLTSLASLTVGDSSLDLNASDAWGRETAAQGVLPPASPGYEGLDEAVQGVGDIERYHPVVHTTIRHGTLRSDQILLANKQLGSHHDVPVQTQDVAPVSTIGGHLALFLLHTYTMVFGCIAKESLSGGVHHSSI